MSLITDFINLLKSIAGLIGRKEFLSVLAFVQISDFASQMEIDGIKDQDEAMMALIYLLLQKKVISVTNIAILEEIANVLEPGTSSTVLESIEVFRAKYSKEKEAEPATSLEGHDSMDISAEDPGWSRPQQESGIHDVRAHCESFDCSTCQKDLAHHLEINCPGLPTVFPAQLTCSQKQILEGRMLEDSKDIATKYSSLVDTTCTSLREIGITVERVVVCLMAITTFLVPRDHFKNRSLFSAKFEELQKSTSIENVFISLHGYHSWFNVYPIRHLITVLGAKSDQDRLAAYEHDLRYYMRRRLFKSSRPIYGEIDPSCIPLVVKLDSSWDNATLHNLDDIKNELSRILKLQPQALLWCSIDEGCVKLEFSVPMFVGPSIVRLAQPQIAQMLRAGVIAFECGDYKFSRNDTENQGLRNFHGTDWLEEPSHCRIEDIRWPMTQDTLLIPICGF